MFFPFFKALPSGVGPCPPPACAPSARVTLHTAMLSLISVDSVLSLKLVLLGCSWAPLSFTSLRVAQGSLKYGDVTVGDTEL